MELGHCVITRRVKWRHLLHLQCVAKAVDWRFFTSTRGQRRQSSVVCYVLHCLIINKDYWQTRAGLKQTTTTMWSREAFFWSINQTMAWLACKSGVEANNNDDVESRGVFLVDQQNDGMA